MNVNLLLDILFLVIASALIAGITKIVYTMREETRAPIQAEHDRNHQEYLENNDYNMRQD